MASVRLYPWAPKNCGGQLFAYKEEPKQNVLEQRETISAIGKAILEPVKRPVKNTTL